MRSGQDLLRDALLNCGTAYTTGDRQRLGLTGRLPPSVETIELQMRRVLDQIHAKHSNLEKYLHLSAVQDENETLFYRTLIEHLEELVPLVYTPTVGEACLQWSHIYVRPRGLYLSGRERGGFAALLEQWKSRDIRVIVVTDGSRILGLGDLGANGMGIPIGKLVLYSACAGIHPGQCLPVMLDVGTNNERLLSDRYYLGVREPRLQGPAYDAMLEEFVVSAQKIFPGALIQFEDFSTGNAFLMLDRYRGRACVFNDDIQGTGAMGLAGVLAAQRITGRRMAEERVLFVGAGNANIGIGSQIIAAMTRAGLDAREAHERCRFVDSTGLVVTTRKDLAEHKRPYAHAVRFASNLPETIDAFRPTILIGATGKPGLFTRDVLQAVTRQIERPLIYALSNPTAKAECTAEEAYAHTDGRAIFASGSPFAPVTVYGRLRVTGQANNASIFPGVGLGVIASGARHVTDRMFIAAAETLAAHVTPEELAAGAIFPSAARLREVAVPIAAAVAEVAYEQGLATEPRPVDIAAHIGIRRHVPRYADQLPSDDRARTPASPG
jgi:malate dehydrogenase (oxaloacetate-decarboxylating)(NADP+)